MRTPLGQVRGLGSARQGTGHFWYQRLTSVANIPLSIFVIALVVLHIGDDHTSIAATLGSPMVSIGLMMFILSTVYHMYLGMQTIIEDYVHHEGLRLLSLMSSTFFCFAIGFACLFAILKLSFGGV
jgi:succinate dehydrogenase / fumarate reductase membrane anchor subunit